VLQKLKSLALMDVVASGTTCAVATQAHSKSNHSSESGHEKPDGAAPCVNMAVTALGGVHMTPVHPKSPKMFHLESPTNSACFRAISRRAQAGGFAHAHESTTSDSVGPGSYMSSMHRCVVMLSCSSCTYSAGVFSCCLVHRRESEAMLPWVHG
jgi:hypothetical protein